MSPLVEKATTDGVSRLPSWLGMTVTSFPSITATTLLVVPRSIPMIFSPSDTTRLLSHGDSVARIGTWTCNPGSHAPAETEILPHVPRAPRSRITRRRPVCPALPAPNQRAYYDGFRMKAKL